MQEHILNVGRNAAPLNSKGDPGLYYIFWSFFRKIQGDILFRIKDYKSQIQDEGCRAVRECFSPIKQVIT